MGEAATSASIDRLADGACAIRFRGELDMASAEVLREPLELLMSQRPPVLIIDFTECGFIDSTGLSVLVGAARSAENGAGPVALGLIGVAEQVRRVLELTGLTEMLLVFDSEQEAMERLGENASRSRT
jgi:anti-sigma B factor antagonist